MVKWSNPAKNALRSIYHYIAEDSTYYAKEVTEKIVSRAEELETFPRLGRMVPELNSETTREILLYSYRVIYEIGADNEITVITIVHAKQEFPK